MADYSDNEIQTLLAEFDIRIPDIDTRLFTAESKLSGISVGADVTDYGQVELIAKLEADAAEARANTYTDNAILNGSTTILEQAALDASNLYSDIESLSKTYADGLVTDAIEAAAITAEAKADLAASVAKAYADDIVTDSEAALIAAYEAKADLAETLAKAYADGIVTDAEAKAIFEAEKKATELTDAALIAAKEYADNIAGDGSDISIEQLDSNLSSIINAASNSNRDVAQLRADMTEARIRDIYQIGKDTEAIIDLQSKTVEIESANSSIIDLDILTGTQATRITQLNTNVNNAYSYTRDYTNTAVGYWNGSTWVDGPIAESIRSMGVTLGDGSSASITNISQAFQDVGGNLVARGGMLTDNKGLISGFINHNDGLEGQFDVLASSFRIGKWENGKLNPSMTHYNNKTLFRDGWVNAAVLQVGNGDTFDVSGNPVMEGARWLVGDPSFGSGTSIVQSYHIDDNGTTPRILQSGRGAVIITPNHTTDTILVKTGGLSLSCFKAEAGTGGMVVADGYTPFTGQHTYLIPINPNPELTIGYLHSANGVFKHVDISNSISYIKQTTFARDVNAIGALVKYVPFFKSPNHIAAVEEDAANVDLDIDLDQWSETILGVNQEDEKELYSTHGAAYINALGEGLLMVCSESGDIKSGQLLCSSSVPGHAMLQTDEETGLYEKYFTDYTVAKASESVIWDDEPSDKKLIAVYYKGG